MRDGKKCLKCGKAKADSAYFKSNSPNHSDGMIPICRKCILDAVYDPFDENLDIEQFQKILRQVDKPYLPELLKLTEKELQTRNSSKTGSSRIDSVIGIYFKYLSSLPQYKNLTWEDSIFDDVDMSVTEANSPKKHKQKFAIMLYNYLQNQYKFTDECSQNLLRMYATFRVEAEHAIIDNDVKRFLRCRNILRLVMNRLAVMRGLDEHKELYDYFSDWVYDPEQREEVWNSPDDEFEIGTLFDGWDDWTDLWDFPKSGE